MNRGRARYSYTPQPAEEGIEDYDEYYTPPPSHHHRRYHPQEDHHDVATATTTKSPCPCMMTAHAQAQAQPYGTPSSSTFDGLDFKQMLLFAGIGILFVVAVDAIVRLASNGKKAEPGTGAGAITIDGRTYVPV